MSTFVEVAGNLIRKDDIICVGPIKESYSITSTERKAVFHILGSVDPIISDPSPSVLHDIRKKLIEELQETYEDKEENNK